MITLYSTKDAARLLGVPQHRIRYAHDTGKLDDTELRVAGKRIYTSKDVKRIAKYFETKK